jgi:hypothetical protein
MKLDGSFGPSKLGPIKDLQAQINGGRIHADQFVFNPELSLPNDLDTALFKELKENLLIQLPWTVLIGIGQGGMARSSNAQMFQLTLTASKAPGNLTERVGVAQLAEEHGHKLAPTREPFGMAFRLSDRDQMLKLHTRKQLQELAEYATKSIHQWPSFKCEIGFGRLNLPHLKGRAYFFKKLFWTRLIIGDKVKRVI